MIPTRSRAIGRREGQRGQILVTAVIAMLAMIGGIALILEGGNAYAHQRSAQNAADAVANSGATVIARRLGGENQTDADVLAAITSTAGANGLTGFAGYYTDVDGHLLNPGGAPAANTNAAARVGDNIIPILTQGVQAEVNQRFGTTFGRAIGFNEFTASAAATSVTGALTGGQFLPAVFPVNIVACDGSGGLGTGEADWQLSEPGDPPIGKEYIVPLCKTGGGSFMLLDLDGTMNNCGDEVANPPNLQFADFPVDIQSDNGNNCAKPMVDEVNKLRGKPVLVPICDDNCTTTGGSQATYHIIRVVTFYLDYMSDQNGGLNPACEGNGTTLFNIVAGNGSSSCIVGWFVRYVSSGPVGRGPITGAGALGIQLKR